jgi:hypothetical protein
MIGNLPVPDSATNRETLAPLLPQAAKQNAMRRNTPEADAR